MTDRLAEMAREARLTEAAEILLCLLDESSGPQGSAGEADLGRWLELARIEPRSAWTRSFEAAEELGNKGFIRGFCGKSRRGSIIATFTEAVIDARREGTA